MALVQHMTAHPDWTVNPGLPDRTGTYLNNPTLSEQQRQTVNRQIQAIHLATPQPKYACPSCRHPVTSKPTEVFIIKDVVRTVAGAEGTRALNAIPLVGGQQRVHGMVFFDSIGMS